MIKKLVLLLVIVLLVVFVNANHDGPHTQDILNAINLVISGNFDENFDFNCDGRITLIDVRIITDNVVVGQNIKCPICGNGNRGPGEQCDDGNLIDGDGCSSECVIEDSDGDGVNNRVDNCPSVANTNQFDDDNDGIGNVCDNKNVGENCVNTNQCLLGLSCDVFFCREVNSCNPVRRDLCEVSNCGTIGLGVWTGSSCVAALTVVEGGECLTDIACISSYSCVNGICALTCGNGVIDGVESCDDGNTISGDGCSSCRLDVGWECSGQPSVCTERIEDVAELCGNGLINQGEQCDGGNLNGASCESRGFSNGDLSCSASCEFDISSCVSMGDNTVLLPLCTFEMPFCSDAVCGNGVVEEGEQCDDGNIFSRDGCSAECTIAVCGNNIYEFNENERCDDGNIIDGDGCSSTCQTETYNPSMCGDNLAFRYGSQVGNEICDGSDLRSLSCTNFGFVGGNLGCSSNCQSFDFSGCDAGNRLVSMSITTNGIYCEDSDDVSRGRITINNRRSIQSIAEDSCVGYNRLSEPICSGFSDYRYREVICPGVCIDGACVSGSATCGNGKIEFGEQCDDGNTIFDDGCSRLCYVELSRLTGWNCVGQPSICTREICGNGIIGPGEQCDDGNMVDNDGCSNSCKIEKNYLCNGLPSICSKFSVGEQKMLVILLDFEGTPQRNHYFRRITKNVFNEFASYVNDVSYGRASVQFDIAGPYLTTHDGCFLNSNNQRIVLNKAIALADPQVDFSNYKRVVILRNDEFPLGLCNSGSGINSGYGIQLIETNEGTIPITLFRSGSINQDLFNIAHEVGHSFGDILFHVDYLRCGDQSNRVTLSEDITSCERRQWSFTGPQGQRLGFYNAANTEFMGWLQPSQSVMTSSGNYVLTPLSVNSNNLKIIKIPSPIRDNLGEYNYFLEFRQPIGRDVNIPPGVHLYLQRTGTPFDFLLDTPPYPDPAEFGREGIQVGQPVTLPGGITITLTSQTSEEAQISITNS